MSLYTICKTRGNERPIPRQSNSFKYLTDKDGVIIGEYDATCGLKPSDKNGLTLRDLYLDRVLKQPIGLLLCIKLGSELTSSPEMLKLNNSSTKLGEETAQKIHEVCTKHNLNEEQIEVILTCSIYIELANKLMSAPNDDTYDVNKNSSLQKAENHIQNFQTAFLHTGQGQRQQSERANLVTNYFDFS